MSRTAPKTSIAAWITAVGAASITIMAFQHAAHWYQRPIAGLLATPDGNVSSIGMPTWSGIDQGLRFPDRLLSIDGVTIAPSRAIYAGTVWDRAVETAEAQGRSSVHARVATERGEREVDLDLAHLDAVSWWLYGGINIFTGALYALAAVIALSTSPRGALSRTFAKFAIFASLYFLTFFDNHTSRQLVPLFITAFACVPFALISLALRLPDDVPLIERRPWLLRVPEVAGLGLAALLVQRDFVGASVTSLTAVCSMLLGGALISFVLLLGIRYARARGSRRETFRVLFLATATPYLIVGAGVLVAQLSSRGSTAAFFAIPAMALAPIATGVAFVRHDLWGSRAILSRMLTRAIAGGIAGVLAIGFGAAVAASLGVPFRGALIGASLGALISAPLVYFVTRWVERRFFPAATEYKPTIEQLSEELTSITDPNEIARAVERTVRRWLPCERLNFVTTDEASPDRHEPRPIPEMGQDKDELSIPASFGGRTLGWLSVGRKRGGALFTSDDVDLLATIVNQAGLALAHAHSYAELERRRQQQAAAWQTERLALVETVAAEIAHEVRYPINFFRSVFRRDAANATLDAEEVDIGCEEVDRLERLVSGLRRMVGHRIDRQAVSVGDLAARAEMLLRDALGGRGLEIVVPRDAALRCDTDQVTQVLVNLVANAIDASGPRGRVGVTWSTDDDGADLVIWDDGPGFESDPSQLFSAWFTTKPRGTGLGLAITQRIVRAHGWGIDAVRVEGRTRFVVSIPTSDVIGTERPVPLNGDGVSLAARGSEHEDSHR